jgi:glycosyltransferase involved in cell wall biosynthesis
MPAERDLLIVLTYYAPYVSGLTNVARDLAEGLAARGYRVTVVTSRYEPGLPAEEEINGVRVLRAPVLARIGKGVISPQFVRLALREARRAQVVNLHLPMLEAGLIATMCRRPLVVNYHCDVSLPPGLLSDCQRLMVDASSRQAMRRTGTVIVSSEDYARNSRMWRSIEPAMVEIPPTCPPCPGGSPTYRDGDGLHVGFLGRIVAEKGLEYLVEAFRRLDDPDARLLIGGDFTNVAGGSVIHGLKESIQDDPRIKLLGFVPEERLPDFYASVDLLALPSVNPLEAFGIVQVVAMLAHVPVLVSNIPGVRMPVRNTGFGEIVEPRDVNGLHRALSGFRADSYNSDGGAERAAKLYDANGVIDAYQRLFDDVVHQPDGAGRQSRDDR